MANIFPDPTNQTEYVNSVTNQTYLWNNTTKAWRLQPAEEGGGPLVPDPDGADHQDGTLDDRYVEISGDTMQGDLIQLPSEDIFPTNQGEMSTAVVGETELEFRFMNSSDVVVCASLDLTPCGKPTDPVIEIEGSAEVFADYGDKLTLVSDGIYPNATLKDQSWESSDDGNTWAVVAAAAPPCLLYTSPSPRDLSTSRMPSSA